MTDISAAMPYDYLCRQLEALVEDYAAWLASEHSPPKLFIDTDPGSTILVVRQREPCARRRSPRESDGCLRWHPEDWLRG
ncbi:MAG: hypothetical protein ACI87W_000877 [Halieaceae bacterium]|jgi:hypothetical protein